LAVATNRRHSNRSVQRLMSPMGQTAKNTLAALTSELPPITDMGRPRGNALRLPCAAKPLRAASGQIAFGFWKKIADGRVAIAHGGPKDAAQKVDGRRVGVVGARTRADRRRPMPAGGIRCFPCWHRCASPRTRFGEYRMPERQA